MKSLKYILLSRSNMTKALAICPFCDDPRAFTAQGLIMHIRSKHPDKLEEFKANKKMYMEKFACDEAGNPLEAPEPAISEPAPEPTPEPTPVPTPEPKPTPAQEVTPPTPKKKEEKPAEGGLFHRIATGFLS